MKIIAGFEYQPGGHSTPVSRLYDHLLSGNRAPIRARIRDITTVKVLLEVHYDTLTPRDKNYHNAKQALTLIDRFLQKIEVQKTTPALLSIFRHSFQDVP